MGENISRGQSVMILKCRIMENRGGTAGAASCISLVFAEAFLYNKLVIYDFQGEYLWQIIYRE